MEILSGATLDILGVAAIFLLVAANGFFVATEFSLVAVRRSRVAELAAAGKKNANHLLVAVEHLDANLAATQLGITISSLALGWIGEPALAHLIMPLLSLLPIESVAAPAHALAIAISFVLITSLHIVLGELAPKSLALQCSEKTALVVVRPLGAFLFVFRPAIMFLNGLGNLVLKLVGLHPGAGEESMHSPEELKLLIRESQAAGILQQAQQEVVVRVLNIGERPIGDIMTPRTQVDWIDSEDEPDEIVKAIRACPHEQVLVGRGSVDQMQGVVMKADLLEQILEGKPFDLTALLRQPLMINESKPIFKVLDDFKAKPIRIAFIFNEYGSFEGVVTQTDLLEAIAGDLPDVEGQGADVVRREDGSLLIDGLLPAYELFDRLGIAASEVEGDFHTAAGFVLAQLPHFPQTGDVFEFKGWRFEIVDMDGRRIDKLLVSAGLGTGPSV